MSYLTITFKGVDFEVEFDYQPEEAEVRYYSDGSGYPGCAEEIDIIEVTHKGEDVTEILEVYFEELEAEISKEIHNN